MGGSDTTSSNKLNKIPTVSEVLYDFLQSINSLSSSESIHASIPAIFMDDRQNYKFNCSDCLCYWSLEEFKNALTCKIKFEENNFKCNPLMNEEGRCFIVKISLKRSNYTHRYDLETIPVKAVIDQMSSGAESNDIRLNKVFDHVNKQRSICETLYDKTFFEFVHRWPSTLMTLENYKKLTNFSLADISERCTRIEHKNITLYIEKFNCQHASLNFNNKEYLIDKMTKLAMVSFFKDITDEIIPIGGVQWSKLVADESGERCVIVDSDSKDKDSFINIIPISTNVVKVDSYSYWTPKELYDSCKNTLCVVTDKCAGEVQLYYDGYPFTARLDESKKLVWQFSPTPITEFCPSSIEPELVNIIQKSLDTSEIVHLIKQKFGSNHSFSLLNQQINLFIHDNKVLTEKEFAQRFKFLYIKFTKGLYQPNVVEIDDNNWDLIKIYQLSLYDPVHVHTLGEFLKDLRQFRDKNVPEFTPFFTLGNVTFDLDILTQKATYPFINQSFPCDVQKFPSTAFNFISLISASQSDKKHFPVSSKTMIEYLTPIAEKYPYIWVILDCNIFEMYLNDEGILSCVRNYSQFIQSKVNTCGKITEAINTLFSQQTNTSVDQIIQIVKENISVSMIEKLTLIKKWESEKIDTLPSLNLSEIKKLDNYLWYDCHQSGPVTVYLGKKANKIISPVLLPESNSPPVSNFCFTVETLKKFLESYELDDYIMLNYERVTQERTTFYGSASLQYAPNVINYPECKFTEIKRVGQVLLALRHTSDKNKPVVCDGKPFHLIQRTLDGKSLLIPVFDEKTPTIAESFLNPLNRLNQLAVVAPGEDLLLRLAKEVGEFDCSLFTKPIRIVKIDQQHFIFDEFINMVPVMKETNCFKIFRSTCTKNVHTSEHHYLALYTYVGRDGDKLIEKYQRMMA